MNGTVNERIKTLFEISKSKSIRNYALKIGVPPTTLNECIKGSEPRFSLLNAILNGEPSISANWLMNGEGNMFKNESAANSTSASYSGTFSEPINTLIGSGSINTHEAANTNKKEENKYLKEIEKLKKQIEIKDILLEEKDRIIKMLLEKR